MKPTNSNNTTEHYLTVNEPDDKVKFDEHHILHELHHYLPAQAPLKDFIHHNTLHAFQHLKFYDAIRNASGKFGYKVMLSLNEYRKQFKEGKIKEEILDRVIKERIPLNEFSIWKNKIISESYETAIDSKIGKLRANWKTNYLINIDAFTHPLLFRVVCSYLDQGISIWNFPVHDKGFLSSIRELERNSFSSFFKTERARHLLLNNECDMEELLKLLVGDSKWFNQYLFDQQFAHQGWSGIVSSIENNPNTLIDQKKISLHDLIVFELLLEIDALDSKFGKIWKPLSESLKEEPEDLFSDVIENELSKVMSIWQDAFEWTYYNQVLNGIAKTNKEIARSPVKSFQALFCIDDRECSIRRYLEVKDPNCETYGTPGFFNVEFYYQPVNSKFYTKLCPAPVTPKYLIKEIGTVNKIKKDFHLHKKTHSLFQGWLITQTLGFVSALRLFFNIFRPSITPATSTSFKHMDKFSKLTIECDDKNQKEDNLQVGFTIYEMADRVEGLLKSIGLINQFAPIIYVVGHGSSSVNNPHYSAYDCGACSGRPGSVNARVICHMANHKQVRELLKERGIKIPDETQFVGALHDTTRDDIEFYDEQILNIHNIEMHLKHIGVFKHALDFNAKERSRRLESINSQLSPEEVHKKLQIRSVSLFEPRPELNHATNTLCIVGRRELTKNIFLDRRSFLNSFDYKKDPEGNYLFNILKAAAPVCGGINLEYYFSRVDNQKLGAGTKLPHNVMGLIGVANGIDGDLRPGLPSQMIEIHDPLRLLMIVEHVPETVLNVIKRNNDTYEWFKNEWVHLIVADPDSGKFFRFKNEVFEVFELIKEEIRNAEDLFPIFEKEKENLPVLILK